jgi:hypothetical protein
MFHVLCIWYNSLDLHFVCGLVFVVCLCVDCPRVGFLSAFEHLTLYRLKICAPPSSGFLFVLVLNCERGSIVRGIGFLSR